MLLDISHGTPMNILERRFNPLRLQVQKGDILGFMTVGATNILAIQDVTGSYIEVQSAKGTNYASQSWETGNYYTFPDAQAVNPVSARHMLKAHIIRPSLFKFSHIHSYV